MVTYANTPNSTAKELMERWDKVKKERLPLEPVIQEVCELICPSRSDFLNDIDDFSKVGKKIFDGTPQGALMIWVDGIQGYVVSSALRWFTLSLVNQDALDDDEIKAWLKKVESRIYAKLGASNYYSVMPEYLMDGGCIGTANKFIHEDLNTGRIVFNVEHPRNVWIVNNIFGEVSEVYVLKEMSLQDAAKRYGKTKLSSESQQDLKDNPYKKVKFLQVILPNSESRPGVVGYAAKPLLSFHIEIDKKHFARKSGYTSMPASFWRTRRRNGYAYGMSPGEMALTEIKRLYGLGKTMMFAAQMSVDGPLNVPEEMKGNVRWNPRGFNWYRDPSRVIKPAYTNINYPIGSDREEQVRDSIRRRFNVDFFLAVQNGKGDRTAEEIRELQWEKAALLSPQLEGLSSDSLDDDIRRVYDIMAAAGEIPDPPQKLIDMQGENEDAVQIDYIGPLAQRRKQHHVMNSIRQSLADIEAVAAHDPSVMDNYDYDELSLHMTDVNGGFPAKVIVPKDVRDEVRQKRADDEKMQQGMEMAAVAADAAGKVSGPMDANSPLAEVMQTEM